MTQDGWPSPDAPAEPLPRIEDLPIADRGYEQEAVRDAFDAFYRHVAQLDVSLRALEAVEVFRRDADALRADLRALRALGFGGGARDLEWATPRYEVTRNEVPVVALRLAAEAALIVAVAVISGVAHFRPAVVIALMAAAFVIVAVSEWLAARARFVPPAVAFLPALDEREPAPYVEAPPHWAGLASEDTEPEALTMIVRAGEDEDEQGVDPWERQLDDEEDDDDVGDDSDDAAEPEPELADKGGLFRRRRR